MRVNLIAVAATTALTAGLLFAAPAADANVHKRVRVVGGYGHVIVYDFYWHWGLRERHKSVWPGHQSPRSWSVDYVKAVGETTCGGLWWTNPSPDRWEGDDMLVSARRVSVRVTPRSC